MATQTPNLGLYKPEQADTVGATIGTHLPANFDIIDNLAAQPNSYASGVSGFTPDSIKAALDALAGVRIVEMATNANGTYVRWENGLQVCFSRRKALFNLAVNEAWGSLYRSAVQTWTFPAAFTNNNVVVSGWVSGDGSIPAWLVGGSPAKVGAVSADYRVVSAQSWPDLNTGVYLLAVGEWK